MPIGLCCEIHIMRKLHLPSACYNSAGGQYVAFFREAFS